MAKRFTKEEVEALMNVKAESIKDLEPPSGTINIAQLELILRDLSSAAKNLDTSRDHPRRGIYREDISLNVIKHLQSQGFSVTDEFSEGYFISWE